MIGFLLCIVVLTLCIFVFAIICTVVGSLFVFIGSTIRYFIDYRGD